MMRTIGWVAGKVEVSLQGLAAKLMLGAVPLVLVTVLFLSAENAQAGFSYDESVVGDFPDNSPASPVYPLGFGTNTFSGLSHFEYGAGFGDDLFDSFAFSVPTGGTLVSILIDISLQPVGSGAFTSVDYRLQDNLFSTIDTVNIPIPSSGLSLFSSSLSLPAGQYALRDISHAGGLVEGEFRIAEYTFTLEVVPEPSTLALSSVGLLLVGWWRRKRA